VYNWPANTERHQRVDRFVEAFSTHLHDIKARRPRWHDFDTIAAVAGWTRLPAAEQWLKKAGLSPEPDKTAEHAQLLLDPSEREALFREFAGYRGASKPAKATAETEVPFDALQREALFREFSEYQGTLERDKARTGPELKQRQVLFREFAEYEKSDGGLSQYLCRSLIG